jgi:hypothetical protein
VRGSSDGRRRGRGLFLLLLSQAFLQGCHQVDDIAAIRFFLVSGLDALALEFGGYNLP